MKLSKLEWMIWRLLLEADHPMSVSEIAEHLPFRFLPAPIVSLAVESLMHKKLLAEAGVHRSYTDGACSRTIVYAPSRTAQERKEQEERK